MGKATAKYVAAFEAFAGNGASGAPGWLKELRANAITRFGDLGFPTTRMEDWRFTSVRRIADGSFVLAGDNGAPSPADLRPHLLNDVARLVFVNGRYSADLSDTSGVPDTVVAGSLSSSLGTHGDLVRAHLGQHAQFDKNGFAALNTAFASDGAFIHVPAKTRVERPIQVLYWTVSDGEPVMVHPRSLVVVDDGGSVQLVETYAGPGGDLYLSNPVTEVIIGDAASVACYRVQRESEAAYHVATTHSRQGRDSRYVLHTVPFGAALTRHDIRMVLDGEGGEGILNGLYIAGASQHVDHNTVIEHAKAHCESHEYFNGVLDDRAHAVFNGRIVVRPGAQKTDSKQTNNNLLLSEDARADSQPQLEIYADDVRCTHGATLGPLDENAMFYLQSRGIDTDSARQMLTYGFGAEILERMELKGAREYLDDLVTARLEVV